MHRRRRCEWQQKACSCGHAPRFAGRESALRTIVPKTGFRPIAPKGNSLGRPFGPGSYLKADLSGAVMRNSLVTTIICSALFLSLTGMARAQNPPWCAIMGSDGTTQCNFDTQQQCLQTISGVGGECIRNPAGNAPNDGQRAPLFGPLFAPSSENAQGLQPLQSQDPGPPPGLGAMPPPPNN